MGFQIRVLMILGMSVCLASVVHAKQGTSVFYSRPYLPSACFGYQDQGIMIAGANPTLYDGGKVCGRRYKDAEPTRLISLKMPSPGLLTLMPEESELTISRFEESAKSKHFEAVLNMLFIVQLMQNIYEYNKRTVTKNDFNILSTTIKFRMRGSLTSVALDILMKLQSFM
ncbi:unnamed protein product [Fraxinus pennsylvanica]|uniref:Uncharacterized protein n=1 Tax=Fraxinus pennsylvanica TaxID=56036 RepID=A0AAD1Z1K3_9LAMI|nr:unnamed protein product [Fraxinus pennsylvanica]